jgi:hypothetical protein
MFVPDKNGVNKGEIGVLLRDFSHFRKGCRINCGKIYQPNQLADQFL